MRRRTILGVTGAALLATAPSTAQAELRSTAHGPVDLGDRVAYEVTGARCATVGVAARLLVGAKGTLVAGPRTTPRPLPDGGCAGVATLPTFADVTAAGWEAGDRLDVQLVSARGVVPLRYARMEADLGDPVAGSPDVVPADDQDTGDRDRAVALDPGDAISLGRVDLRRADGLAVRACVAGADTSMLPPSAGPLLAPERLEPPTYISIRQDGPDGAPLMATTDIAASPPQEVSRLSSLGFGGCYRLVVLPITRRLQERAPELFLRAEAGLPGVLKVNSVDVTGTGAKVPVAAPPPLEGMRTLFDGTSFDGWDVSGCALRDGAATQLRTGDEADLTPCTLTSRETLRDVVLRFRLRREDITDNAGIYLGVTGDRGGQEIQLRSVGEYGPGGYFGQYAARWQKLSAFPDYDELEVVQLGARHVVSVNGRTVTDVLREGGAPEPYLLRLTTQPEFSYRFGAEAGFGNEGSPDVGTPGELGAFWFKDVRVKRCAGPDDPVCRRIADARRGQVPVPAGAPAALPPLARPCAPRRSVVLTLPRGGLRGLRVTAGGRAARATRLSTRRVRVRLPGTRAARVTVVLRGRTPGGRAVRITRRVAGCR